MKLPLGLAATLLCAFAPLAFAQLPAQVGDTPVPSLAPMVKRVSPAVVNIATKGTVQEQNPLLNDPFFRRFFDVPNAPRQREFQSAGSGVIVDAKQGYIITNAHVIENATEITVTLLDNRALTAKVVGKDPGSDVAVLQVPAGNLSAIPLGDSDRTEVGDFVVAIGADASSFCRNAAAEHHAGRLPDPVESETRPCHLPYERDTVVVRREVPQIGVRCSTSLEPGDIIGDDPPGCKGHSNAGVIE
jgi:S1-C subfamily serine protease